MKNTITCQHCGAEIDLPEALKHELQGQLEEKLSKKLNEQFELKVSNLNKEREEEKERTKRLLTELEKLNAEIRALRRKDEERELEMTKKMAGEEEKIREETRKKTLEEHELKDREKDKKLQDTLKQVEELKVQNAAGIPTASGRGPGRRSQSQINSRLPPRHYRRCGKRSQRSRFAPDCALFPW